MLISNAIMSAMRAAPIELHRLSPELAVCQTYDAQVKADLFATALTTSAGILLVDPFEIDGATLSTLTNDEAVAGVVVTNENHIRASASIGRRLCVPVYADCAANVPDSRSLDEIASDIRAISIPGAPAGEVALRCPRERGTLIVGDAVINFGTHGFALLPAKYCTNAKLMRRSLRQLLELDFERILFAHGTPVLTNARDRLAALLESET